MITKIHWFEHSDILAQLVSCTYALQFPQWTHSPVGCWFCQLLVLATGRFHPLSCFSCLIKFFYDIDVKKSFSNLLLFLFLFFLRRYQLHATLGLRIAENAWNVNKDGGDEFFFLLVALLYFDNTNVKNTRKGDFVIKCSGFAQFFSL